MKLDIHQNAKAIIFDLDGTLSNSFPLHIEIWHQTCAKYGCKFDENIIAELTGMPTIRFAERIKSENNLKVDPQEIVKEKQTQFWINAHKIQANKPVVDIVKKYYGKLPMSVGTGASRRSAELQLETLQIKDYFDFIVSADDVDKHKPEPDTFLKCAKLMNVSPEYCHVFEDGDLGMQAAESAGMFLTDVKPYLDTI